MSPKPTTPVTPAEIEEAPSTLERLLENRSMLYAALGGIALIVLIIIVSVVYGYTSRKAKDRAWTAYYETIRRIREAADPTYAMFPEALILQAVDADLQIREFQALSDEVAGTSVEPYALYHLAAAYMKARKLDRAEELLQGIKSNYPRHYLVDSDRFYFRKSLVDKALEDCAQERGFLDANPDFLAGVTPAPRDEAGDEGAVESPAPDPGEGDGDSPGDEDSEDASNKG